MKKNQWLKMAVFCLPLVLYSVLFVLYEPCNYWGIRSDFGNASSAITVIRRILNTNCENVIISSSKLAALNTAGLKKIGFTDEDWINLSMNGATIPEKCDMFWQAVEKGNVKKVVFTVSFWGSQYLGGISRVQREHALAEDSFAYILSSDIHQEVLKELFSKLTGLFAPLESVDDFVDDPTYDSGADFESDSGSKSAQSSPLTKEERFAKHAAKNWGRINQYQFCEDYADQLRRVIEYCQANGIELRLVAPPLRKEVYEWIERYGVSDALSFYKNYLSQFTTVYNMEYPESVWTEDVASFADTDHFPSSVLRNIAKADIFERHPMLVDVFNVIFHGEGEEVRILRDELSTLPVFSDSAISLTGDGELQIYSGVVTLRPESTYIISCKGGLETDAEVMYMDFFRGNYANSELIFWPVKVADSEDEFWKVMRTKDIPGGQYYLRIVYQGNGGLDIEQLEIREVEPATTLLFADEAISLAGGGELQIYYGEVRLEPESEYIITCKGNLDVGSELLYMDFFLDGYVNEDLSAFVPERLADSSGISRNVVRTSDVPEGTYFFRIVYQGEEALDIDWVNIHKVDP